MKPRFLWLCLLLPTICLGKDEINRAAVLIFPDQVEYTSGSSHYLSAEIGFRWDETKPLRINVWRNPKSGKADRILGDIEIFDEKERKLEQQFFVSLPPMPDGEMVINRGEYKRLVLFIWNGGAVFPGPGNYYAIATFSDAWTGDTNVIFTTRKWWFKAVEAPPKPKKT